MAQETVRSERLIQGLVPGRKYNVYIRAVDGNGNMGRWSDPAQVIAGITGRARLSMGGTLNLSAVNQGVRVSWDAVTGAKGYVVYATFNSVNWPDITTVDDIMHQGRSRNIVIPADNGDTLKVRVLCYDQAGIISTNYIQGEQTSGTPA